MVRQYPESAWSIIDLASCLINSQLFLDNTHSCFTKMKKKKDGFILSSDIKIFVQVGAWACAIVLTFRLLADYSNRLLGDRQQRDSVEMIPRTILVAYDKIFGP